MSDKPGLLRLQAQEGQSRNGSPIRDIQEQLDAALVSDEADKGIVDVPWKSETSLQLPPGLSFEEWQQVGFTLRRINKAWKWWVGDWLNYGEKTYGETYAQAMDELGLSYHDAAQAAYVARKVEPDMRRQGLSWSFHEAVAPLDKEEAGALLERAETHQWKREMLREAVKVLQGKVVPPAVELACQCKCCQTDYCPDCGHPWGE